MCPPDLPTNFSAEPCMKAGLDLSAKYLVLSDIKRQVCYYIDYYYCQKNFQLFILDCLSAWFNVHYDNCLLLKKNTKTKQSMGYPLT